MEEGSHHIWVQTSIYKKKVTIDSILLCKVEKRKVDIYFHPDGKLEGTYHSLTDMETMLPERKFCRCNRQCIINIDHVDKYSEKIPEIVMTNGMCIHVGKDYKENLSKLLMCN